MDLELLDKLLAERGEPRFRARQIWAWAAHGARAYEEMTNLPAALREALAGRAAVLDPELAEQARSRDGTVKTLFETADGRPLEAVLMRYRDGPPLALRVLAVGLSADLQFCATGTMRFGRNLSTSEILDQALHFRRIEAIDHCVFMGMGEPMLNLETSSGPASGCPTSASPTGAPRSRRSAGSRDRTPRRIGDATEPGAVAACGRRSAALRADAGQRALPAAEVIEACRAFHERRRRRVFIEYVMLAGVNDRYEQALALARLRSGHESEVPIFKVNLIPYNPTRAPSSWLRPASRSRHSVPRSTRAASR